MSKVSYIPGKDSSPPLAAISPTPQDNLITPPSCEADVLFLELGTETEIDTSSSDDEIIVLTSFDEIQIIE